MEPALLAARSLAGQGWRVRVACGRGPGPDPSPARERARAFDLDELEGLNLDKHRRWRGRREDAKRLAEFLAAEPAQVLHVHGLNAHLLAAAVAGNSPHPLVVRSLYGLEPVNGSMWRFLFGEPRWDGLVFTSRLAAGGRDSARPPERPLPDLREKLGVKADDFLVGIVARVQARRRFDLLLEAFARARREAPEMKLLVIGRGTSREQLVDEPARRRGLGDRVVTSGYLNGDEYVAALKLLAVKLFLVPGTDGTCRAVREAQAMGKPVIATRRGILPELVTDGEDGLLAGEEPGALAAALLRLYREPDLRLRLGRAARAKALAVGEMRDAGRELAAFYDRLLELESVRRSLGEGG